MIRLTRLNGPPFALNPDLIERVETTPQTVVTLIDETSYVVEESLDEVISRICAARATVVAMAERFQYGEPAADAVVLRLMPDDRHES